MSTATPDLLKEDALGANYLERVHLRYGHTFFSGLLYPSDMRETDPFGRAVYDFVTGEQDVELIQRDGEEARVHPIESFYLGDTDPDRWYVTWLEGPLLDIGAGAGRDALFFQEQFETVAIDVSTFLVETMQERGVRDARCVDMLELREAFDENRFESTLSFGTQLGLVRSMEGLRRFLDDLAFVTSPTATAVLDAFDPEHPEAPGMLGYREDPTPGLAYRVMHFEYDGVVGDTLLFRLFSPERIREAVRGSP